jgi:hypothetical protein
MVDGRSAHCGSMHLGPWLCGGVKSSLNLAHQTGREIDTWSQTTLQQVAELVDSLFACPHRERTWIEAMVNHLPV